MLHVLGETWNLTCSKNDSIENETCIWSRRDLTSDKREPINFGSPMPSNATKFKTVDGGSILVIKNLNEEDIINYCYYCRSKIGTITSECKNMLDQNNTVG